MPGYQYAITVNISSTARETKGSLSLSLHGAYGNTTYTKFTTGEYVVFSCKIFYFYYINVVYDIHLCKSNFLTCYILQTMKSNVQQIDIHSEISSNLNKRGTGNVSVTTPTKMTRALFK